MNEPRSTPEPGDVTRLIHRQQAGDVDAGTHLLQVLYKELRALAASYFGRAEAAQTLQPTALVHEAFLRLVGRDHIDWEGRSHFMAMAAKVMRNILIDHARARRALKRGGDRQRLTLSVVKSSHGAVAFDALDLHHALEDLGRLSERQARIVELLYFGGLTEVEAARVIGVSERTVRGEWRLARAWLRHRLGEEGR